MSRDAGGGARRRIVFVTKTVALGGAEIHLIDLLTGLDVSCVEPMVLCLGKDQIRQGV
jgi:hypothetical protein